MLERRKLLVALQSVLVLEPRAGGLARRGAQTLGSAAAVEHATSPGEHLFETRSRRQRGVKGLTQHVLGDPAAQI